MEVYEVGQPYVPGRTQWHENIEYRFRKSLHQLRLFCARLTEAEIAAVGEGPASFALVACEDQILFLFRFAPAFEWSDAPFSWWRMRPDARTMPPALAPGLSVPLEVILIGADTGLVAALRVFWLSSAFSGALHNAIRNQARLPYDPAAYDARLDDIRRRYAPSAALLPFACAHQEFTAIDRS